MSAKTFSLGGIHPPENKLSVNQQIKKIAIPEQVSIPTSQHIGAPAVPCVSKGDQVKVGQLIAKSAGFISTNIHSSVSGTILKIDKVKDINGYSKEAIIIKVEGDEWLENIDRSEELVTTFDIGAQGISAKMLDAGIVGLGGATFPSHIKMTPPPGKIAQTLLINAVECEPYLTSDHQLMMEKGAEIIQGVRLLMTASQVKKAFIGIENNKADAIQHLSQLAKNYQEIKVVPLKVQYPQGGEKQLIKAVLGREVPSGALPIEVGAVVQNVGTAFAVYEAIAKNKPLIERVVTVAGKSLPQSLNFIARVGTPITKLIEAVGGMPENTGKVISGGPMMGKACSNMDAPFVKGMSGLLMLAKEESFRKEMRPCIRCSKCVCACPMGLEPYLLITCGEKKLVERGHQERVMDCIECGSCSYTCPSNRPLVDYIRLNKAQVGAMLRAKK